MACEEHEVHVMRCEEEKQCTYLFLVLQQLEEVFRLLRCRISKQLLGGIVLWVKDIGAGGVNVLVVLAHTADEMGD